jgi:predicted acetyltransferase
MSQIIYKPLADTDRERSIHIGAQAFVENPSDTREWLERQQVGELRGLYVDERLASQYMLIPMEVMTGTKKVAFGGIAGVATPPEERRQGYVGMMLREACTEMLERGMALSMLYPFKRSFYAQFGWATCLERKKYTGSPEQFAGFRRKLHGRFEPVGTEAVPELNAIYEQALRGRFGPIVRTPYWWEQQVLTEGKNPAYTFIWRDEAGKGRAYISYRFQKSADGVTTMRCRDTVALDPEARSQLFGFIANHADQCRSVFFHAPADAPVNLLLADPLTVEIEPWLMCMLRLLNVEQALNDYQFPKECSGQLRIAVQDDWIQTNNGVYELVIDSGTPECRRLPAETAADMTCDVRVLAQFYARYLRPRTAAAFGMIDVHNRDALLLAEQLFSGLAPFQTDYF